MRSPYAARQNSPWAAAPKHPQRHPLQRFVSFLQFVSLKELKLKHEMYPAVILSSRLLAPQVA